MKKISSFLVLILFFIWWGLVTLKHQSFLSYACSTDIVCDKYVLWQSIYAQETNEDLKNTDKISFNKFFQVYEIIKKKWVESEKMNNTKELEDNIIAGLVRTLDDPYSMYMTEKQNKNFKDDMAWNFQWIWAELQMKDEMVIVTSPLKNSPAINAWLLPQDIIIKVDDEDILWWTLREVVKKIRWPKWEEVILTVVRKTANKPVEIKITRDVIHLTSVEYELKDWNIWYIEVNQFWDSTNQEFFDAIDNLKKNPLKWLILDLRFNWWWYLDWAVILSSPFIEGWKTVTVIKSKKWESVKKVIPFISKINQEIPMIVLINWGSASASEIVAWALRDANRAILLWETSFWKWSVQEIVPLTGDSSLRITTAKWYTPKGQNIHKVWIEPDVKIARTYDDMAEDKDPQLDKAMEMIKEWDFQKFFDEKLSLTWSSVMEFSSTWSLIEKENK